MTASSQLPVIAAAVGSVFGGTGAVAARFLADEAGPATVSLLRYLGLLALLLVWLLFSRSRLPRIAARDLPALVAVGVLQFGLFGWFFSAGFTYVGAARGAIVLSTVPIQTLVLAVLAGRERFSMRKLVGMLLGVAGVAVALGSDAATAGPDAWKGDLLLFAAAFCTALNSVMVGPYLGRYPILVVSLIATGVGCAMLAVAAIWAGETGDVGRLSATSWVVAAYFAAGPTCFGFLAWTWALSRAAPTRVTITIVLNPISAAFAAALILGEAIDLRLVVGLVLVAAAIVMVNWPSGTRDEA